MKSEYVDCEIEDAPVSPLLAEGWKNKYGSVPGLDEEELASPEELERQVFLQEWGPILALPIKTSRGFIQPNIDEYFDVDYGAFDSVDFERMYGEFDKARYKADKLHEELQDVLIRLSVVRYRLSWAQRKVLKHLGKGVIDFDHIASFELQCTARLYLRALKLQEEIRQLRDASWERRRRQLAEVLR